MSQASQQIADANNFVLKSFAFQNKPDDENARIVKIGAAQTSIARETSSSASQQRKKTFEKLERIIEAAAADDVKILCLPELWCEWQLIRIVRYHP